MSGIEDLSPVAKQTLFDLNFPDEKVLGDPSSEMGVAMLSAVDVSDADPAIVVQIERLLDDGGDLMVTFNDKILPELSRYDKVVYQKIFILKWISVLKNAIQKIVDKLKAMEIIDETWCGELRKLMENVNALFLFANHSFRYIAIDRVYQDVNHDFKNFLHILWPCTNLPVALESQQSFPELVRTFSTAIALLDSNRILAGGEITPGNLDFEEVKTTLLSQAKRFEARFVEPESPAVEGASVEGPSIKLEIGEEMSAYQGQVDNSAICAFLVHSVKNIFKVNQGRAISITVRFSCGDGDLKVEVIDNGVGLSYDKMVRQFSDEARKRVADAEALHSPVRPIDRIFCDPTLIPHIPPVLLNYFLLDRGRSFSGGTGLGLSMASRLAQRLGGYINIANRPEGGAGVSMVLPDNRLESPEDRRLHKVMRFNKACKTLHGADIEGRTLLGCFYRKDETGRDVRVEIYSATEREIADLPLDIILLETKAAMSSSGIGNGMPVEDAAEAEAA